MNSPQTPISPVIYRFQQIEIGYTSGRPCIYILQQFTEGFSSNEIRPFIIIILKIFTIPKLIYKNPKYNLMGSIDLTKLRTRKFLHSKNFVALKLLRNFKIKKLSKENLHLTESFDCGDSDLNEFLREDAVRHQNQLIAVTYLCFYDRNIVGYFTLLSDAIEIKGSDKRVFRKIGMSYRTYPAMKIGRMAVDNRYKGYGIGRYLIKIIVSKTISYSKNFGCRYITVDSYPDAVSFYEKMGFVHTISEKEDKAVSMRLDLADIISNKD